MKMSPGPGLLCGSRASLAARDPTFNRCSVVLSQGRAEKNHASWRYSYCHSMYIRWGIQKLTVWACFQKVPWQSRAHRVSRCGPVFSGLHLCSAHVLSDKKIQQLLMPWTCVCKSPRLHFQITASVKSTLVTSKGITCILFWSQV